MSRWERNGKFGKGRILALLCLKKKEAFATACGKCFFLLLGQFTRNYTQTTKRGLLTTNKG